METLLRPAKQLAEWDSCFVKDLETYFNLLKKTQSVNFGEAALILQNSANVYARRVEYLWGEAETLNQTLNTHNDQQIREEAAEKTKNNRKSKSVIDFNDFESLELENLIGHSNNLKEGGQKSLKLLTRRFTQLESNLAQLSTPIEILSTEGEVIGNKYDFRCNQQLTKNCMLVDELTPTDFSAGRVAATSEHENPKTLSINNSNSSFDSMFELNQSAASPQSIVSEEMEIDVNYSAKDNKGECNNILDETDAGYTSGDAAEDSIQQNVSSPTTEQTAVAQAQSSIIEPEPRTESGTTEPQVSVTEEQLTPVTNNKNNENLEPIPFDQSVPDRIPRRRVAFKLPCHISLLKTKPEQRKRKSISKNKTREYMTRFLLDKYDHLVQKKLKPCSATGQVFSPLKKEELEEFQRNFDQYIKSIRGSGTYNYDAVTREVTMELLGFQPHFTKNDPLRNNDTYTAEDTAIDSTSIVEQESDLASVPESFTTPPPTPEVANHRLNYKELVEQRMRQIGEESREQTDLEQRVAEWHRSLRPKLTAAGRRPPFHIHEYGSRIIKALEVSDSNKIPFSNLVQHESAPEVARYFLASLQLANSYNVAINTTGNSSFGIELKLLDNETHHEPLGLHHNIDRIPSSTVSSDRRTRRISTT